jgi:hypothetical protein
MTKYFAAKLAVITFLTASSAFAAPAARNSGDRPCTHCAMSGSAQAANAATRGALYGTAAKPCRHQAATAVRWGVAQKPCPHCTHSA